MTTADARPPQTSRRAAIMAAAVSVLAERGPRGLTHRAVDAAAGLSSGSVNYHAPTRARLLHLALEEVFRHDLDTATRHFDITDWSRPRAAVAITRFVTEMSDEKNRDRVIARHHLRAESMTNPELRAAFDDQHAAFVTMIVQTFGIAGDPVSDARGELVRLGIDGMLQRQVMIGPAPLDDEQIAEMARLLVGS
ncbi:TetR/AcrR family transcriptional regulator [Williamsia sp.]|uniref:TetR/AcrR family transcriptional regulator n=1 Tax=Williamsia sp. TaxID=1872085 RepID=UPI001A20D44C|nr:TetR/AcrR family transcriptional regulator [Williamsia sp.]MBJ7291825.1 TetR/AcrR family transcriptional regulator [Williamsia sp.]